MYIVIALLVITKLCDVASTLQRIGHPHDETNPLANQIMIRLGTAKGVWIVFALALIIIGVTGGAAVSGSNVMQTLFIVVGLAISIVQGAVAYCNWSGKDNGITRRIRLLHTGLRHIVKK